MTAHAAQFRRNGWLRPRDAASSVGSSCVMIVLHEQMDCVEALHHRDSCSSAGQVILPTPVHRHHQCCHAVHVMSVFYSPTASIRPHVAVTVAIHSGPASLLLLHKGGIHATPLAGRKVSSYHEFTGTNIAITALHLLFTALLEHVRREPHICWCTRPDPALLQTANKRPV